MAVVTGVSSPSHRARERLNLQAAGCEMKTFLESLLNDFFE